MLASIFEASDPRDEIYSQFGMLNETERDIIKRLTHLKDEHSLRILSGFPCDVSKRRGLGGNLDNTSFRGGSGQPCLTSQFQFRHLFLSETKIWCHTLLVYMSGSSLARSCCLVGTTIILTQTRSKHSKRPSLAL